MIRRPLRQREGFSRVDLAVGLLIGTMLLGFLLPALHSAQSAAGIKQTANNLKQMSLAAHACNDVYKKLPPAYGTLGRMKNVSVHIHLLPYIEQGNLYNKYLIAEGNEVAPTKVAPFVALIDPSRGKNSQEGIQNFAANLRVFSDKGVATKFDQNMKALAKMEPGTAAIPRVFLDGTSYTISFATKYGYCGEHGGSRYASAPNAKTAAFFGQNAAKKRAHPSDPTATFQLQPGAKECITSPLMAQSFSKKGLIVGIFDGSVRTLSPDFRPEIWNAAVQPNDGMDLSKDWE